jgi:hypothetical protein
MRAKICFFQANAIAGYRGSECVFLVILSELSVAIYRQGSCTVLVQLVFSELMDPAGFACFLFAIDQEAFAAWSLLAISEFVRHFMLFACHIP